jgi:hypothetical protein
VIVCAAACGNEAGPIHQQAAAAGHLLTPPRPNLCPPPAPPAPAVPIPPCPPPVPHPCLPPISGPCYPPTCQPPVHPCPPCGCHPGHHGPDCGCCPDCRKHDCKQVELHQRIEVDFGTPHGPYARVHTGGQGTCCCPCHRHPGSHGQLCPRCNQYHPVPSHPAKPKPKKPPAHSDGTESVLKDPELLPEPEPSDAG